jgi:hypothetical protein
LTAAVYLYAATGNTTYRTFVDNNCNIQPIQWTYWYPFEAAYQDALLYYCNVPGATPGVINLVKGNCTTSVSTNNSDLLPAYNNNTDAYMAQMQDNDYVWGNNQNKCEEGSILYNMVQYNLDAPNQVKYRNAAEGYIHYLHGVNPNGIAFLTNANAFGGDLFTKEIYHGWFGDGTGFDGNVSPYVGPPPGFIPGGVNKNYTPDATYTGPPISPPQNQPVQKSYKDWNTSFPENSWEISEVGIYVNAAYVKLLSKFADTTSSSTSVHDQLIKSDFTFFPNPSSGRISVSGLLSSMNTLIVYDVFGKRVCQTTIGIESGSLQLDLPDGIYFMKISNGEFSKTGKLIIAHTD